jgi:3D (Asp-Asp-Asp) domain-containing protein
LNSRAEEKRAHRVQLLSSRSAESSPWMDFIATWYTPSGGGLQTASGRHVSENLVAVDPSVIPLGSLIDIMYHDGRMERKLAADTGGAIIGNRVDLFCWSEREANVNGRQKVKVRIVGYVKP